MKNILLLSALFIFSLFSCSGDDSDETTPDNPVNSTKKIASIVVTGGNQYELFNSFFYYTNNKLSRVNDQFTYKNDFSSQLSQKMNLTSFQYNGNNVLIDWVYGDGTEEKVNHTVTLNNNGYITSMSSLYFEPGLVQWPGTTNFQYSSDGYLTQFNSSETQNNIISTYKCTYTYTNGNLISEEMEYKKGAVIDKSKITYIYGSDLNKGALLPPVFDFDNALYGELVHSFYAGLLGKPSKNLITSAKLESFNQDGSIRDTTTVTVTYTLNDGYVSKSRISKPENKWHELTYTYND